MIKSYIIIEHKILYAAEAERNEEKSALAAVLYSKTCKAASNPAI